MNYSFQEFLLNLVALAIIMLLVMVGITLFDKPEPEFSTAKPIYQQQIGDEAEPDILIIYEAEVDGVKVYPSVIKEVE